MNRISLAFLLALFVYSIFATFIWQIYTLYNKQNNNPKEYKQKIKISLKTLQNHTPLQKKQPRVKKKNKKVFVKNKKTSLQEKPKKMKERREKKEKKFQKKKSIQQPILKKKIFQKTPIPTKQPIRKKEKSLLEILSQDMSSTTTQPKQLELKDAPNIQALYGKTFEKLSTNQQRYILDNQEIMRRITQDVLNRVAMINIPSTMSINAQNIVEFYLYPNGDMSDFKFLSKSGNHLLDDVTKETIEYAYAKYPRPKEKTLIRYNVVYNLLAY